MVRFRETQAMQIFIFILELLLFNGKCTVDQDPPSAFPFVPGTGRIYNVQILDAMHNAHCTSTIL